MNKFHAFIVYFPLTRKKYLLFPTNITINFVLFVAFIEYAPYSANSIYFHNIHNEDCVTPMHYYYMYL